MLRTGVFCPIFGLLVSAASADEPKNTGRPITEADSVLAVYRVDSGLSSTGVPAIILAAWPDGHIVWSDDRLAGGAPYHAGRVDPKKVTALLARFEKDGLFADKKLNDAHFGPDSKVNHVFIKSGNKQVEMRSWHEGFEVHDGLVVDHKGAAALEGRRRLDVLREAPADYLYFRLVWSETRTKLSDLIPGESSISAGTPRMKAGVLSWQEPTGNLKSDSAGPARHTDKR